MSKAKGARKRQKKARKNENCELQELEETATQDGGNRKVRTVGQAPMFTILSNAQLNETFHKRYIKELKQLYTKLDHDGFMFTFIEMFKTVLEADDNNEYGNTAMAFCAKFVTSFESENTHPILAETFRWLLTTISPSPQIRYRICFFVNLILKHLGPFAALDDSQCDQILHYMLDRLKDMSPSVRKEAVLAMQRLQMPDNPNDPVLCAYRYHLSADPSSSVRQCVISCMGRNYLTVPHILERLWDVDEKVRRHTYINMCNYPVRSYKVSQRLTLIECGLNDSSPTVRKNVLKYMLNAWLESYQHNYIQLTAALKLDSSEEDIIRFRRVAKQMLLAIFEQQANQELLAQLPLSEDCELHRCVPHEELTVELLLYWQCLSSYFQQTSADEFELILPELSVFCDYVKKFCQFQKPDMDKFAQIEFQCMLLSLVEILQTYDLGDEIGRLNLKDLITHLLKECLLDHKIVCILVRITEQLLPDFSARMLFFIEIIYEICELNAKQNDLVHDRSLIDKLLGDVDTSLVTNLNSLKVKILELEELEENFVRQKEYIRAQAVNDEKIAVTEEYTELIQPLVEKHGVLELPTRPKLSKQERVLKGLQISFYMVASRHVSKLNHSICKLYKDFICRHLASLDLGIFEWSIKCGTTFSLLYEAYAKEVFDVLVDQFYKDNNLRLCETAAHCIFELMDYYGVDYFIELNQTAVGAGQAPKSKRRMLYTMQDFYDGEEDRNQSQNSDQNTDIIGMMGFFVEKVVDKGILLAIVRGLCRLILRGHLENRSDVLEKLLKRYFNPNTEPIVSQVLGLFFENLVEQKLQHILQPCLLPIVWSIMNSSYDSPLHDVVPGHVTKFFIDLTALDKSSPENNIHNQIALSFLHYIQNYYTERKEMCRLLAKDLTTLKLNVRNCSKIKDEMTELADNLNNSELEPRLIRSLADFKNMLNGRFKPPAPAATEGNESDADAEECESIAATTVSLTECEPKRATVAPNLEVIEEAAENRSVNASPAVESGEPVLTTFGKNNQVGLRYLRRSLHNSISQSDGENSEPKENTPEATIVNENSQSEAAEETETEAHNDSEVIEASPEASQPAIIASRLRHNRNQNNSKSSTTNTTRSSPLGGSKQRKVLHLEIQTPIRNGRKRVVRRAPQAPASTDSASSSQQRISPLRKQQRLEAKTPSKQQSSVPVVTVNGKIISSPTGSSSSSLKENSVPTESKTPQSRRRLAVQAGSSSPASRVITRHSAQKLRISAMCMTRKRMLLETSLTEGNLKVSTPKRVRTAANTNSSRKTRSANKSTAAAATETRESRETRATTTVAATSSSMPTRSRRK